MKGLVIIVGSLLNATNAKRKRRITIKENGN
jgi:hypothetical protein